MIIPRLALQSLCNRRLTAILAVSSIALSVALLLGVEKVRNGARESFANTISGTDLVAGARGGGVQLLLYSVFRIGNASNNITWESYQDIASRPEVAWIVPLSLGDSHHGYRVLGTTADYFEHYKFRRDRGLQFATGGAFTDLFDAVLGSDVAEALGYKLGDPIVVAHGIGRVSFQDHGDKPFRVAGILEKTGTPVDRTVHVSLEAIEAIHVDWQSGAAPQPGQSVSAEEVRRMELQPKAVTAALIGLKSKLGAFTLQRWINEYDEEPLTAVLPGVALQELWSIVGAAEQALLIISAMVVATALIGMMTAIFSTLNERRREMAILRSVGARPLHVLGLLVAEAGLLAIAGTLIGFAVLYGGLILARPLIDAAFGLYIDIGWPGRRELITLLTIVLAGLVAGFLPAFRAYRSSLADGLVIRV
jgi:putative ABC transport system permease protein